MTTRRYLAITLIGLSVCLLAALWMHSPGYMDAEYYFTTARRLKSGNGFTEPFLWNYLDDPTGLPHPSHMYWMPLTSLVCAASMAVFGDGYRSAQVAFVVLTTLLPLLTFITALRLHGDQKWAWRAGIFAAFPGIFLPYFITTDSFSLYAILGLLALWTVAEASERSNHLYWLAAGLLIGLAHLTRADGVLLMAPSLLAIVWVRQGKVKAFLYLVFGYLLCMAPWWIRNFAITGSVFASGTSRVFWLLSYDELFSFPADILTPARWWQSGLGAIIGARLKALGINLQSLIAVNGLVFLCVFMVIGARRLWKRPLVRLTTIYLGLLLVVMSFVFPFAGVNGGFFHSSAAAMVVLWALVPVGLDSAIAWGARLRGWNRKQATLVFTTSAIVLAGLLTTFFSWRREIGSTPLQPVWDDSLRNYQMVGEVLTTLDPEPGLVAVNNPPGFHLATNLPAVVVPNGTVDTLQDVVESFGVDWIVLDVNRPMGMAELFDGLMSVPWLEVEAVIEDSNGRPIQLLRVISRGNNP